MLEVWWDFLTVKLNLVNWSTFDQVLGKKVDCLIGSG